MIFGTEGTADLTAGYFVLPKATQTVLPGTPAADPKIYVGMPSWGRKEWVGKLYPPSTREKEMAGLYTSLFNSIEFNTTHYKIYPEENILKWAGNAGDRDFMFCPKMFKGITHFGSLSGKEKMTGEFLESVAHFGKHLGPVYIQVAESFSPKRADELVSFLETLPKQYQFFLELRHPSWFENEVTMDDITNVLRRLNIGFTMTDTLYRRDTLHMRLTTKEAMIRFRCTTQKELDEYRIREWKAQLQDWFQKGLKTCYFFLHLGDEDNIGFAKYVQEELSNLLTGH